MVCSLLSGPRMRVILATSGLMKTGPIMGEALREGGHSPPHGKTRTWNRAGQRPPDMEDLGPDVWSQEGVKILGTPLGSDVFIATSTTARLEEEARLWEAVSWVSDPQCAWQIVLQRSGPRCHHYLRTVAPSQSQQYAEGTTRECGRQLRG